MVTMSDRSAAVRHHFPGGEVVKNLLFNYFEGSIEGIMGREAEIKRFFGKMWGNTERWCYGNCGIHVSTYLVHARLDCWILSQDCRNTYLWHDELLN